MSTGRVKRHAFTLVDLAALVAGGTVALSMFAIAVGSPTPQPSDPPTSTPTGTPTGTPTATPAEQPESTPAKKPHRRRPSDNPPAVEEPEGLTGSLRAARASARQFKDESQIRGVTQSMIIFAGNNGDNFPLPSSLDRRNETTAEVGAAKDTTANIFSLLISQGFVPTEMLVSPAEVNPRIKVFPDYAFYRPARAVDPKNAYWDPAFSADFTNGHTGNTSYATMCLTPERRALWKSNNQRNPIVGNRGPHVSKVEIGSDGKPSATLDPAASNTLKIHGKPDTWEGVIGFADNSAEYVQTMSPKLQYTTSDKTKRADVLFFDEPDDASKTNAFLTITIKGGAKPEDMKWIWD